MYYARELCYHRLAMVYAGVYGYVHTSAETIEDKFVHHSRVCN